MLRLHEWVQMCEGFWVEFWDLSGCFAGRTYIHAYTSISYECTYLGSFNAGVDSDILVQSSRLCVATHRVRRSVCVMVLTGSLNSTTIHTMEEVES